MPRAAQQLTEEDWAEVATTVPDSPDPLFGENIQERFAALRKQLEGEAKASRQESIH